MTTHDELDGLLQGAIGAAHRALQRLDDADVPAGLRQVRSASRKRKLPAPLRRKLLEGLEEMWLRDLALAELDDGDEAGRLFLARPEGWDTKLQEMAFAREQTRLLREEAESAAELNKLRTLNADLSARLDAAHDRIVGLELRLADDERVEAMKRRLGETGRTVSQLESDLEQARRRVAELEGELSEADDRISHLRTRLAQSASQRSDSPGQRRAFGRGDPIETARLLDELIETLRPLRETLEPQMPRPVLQLPPGVRPDLPEAIDWVLHLERRIVLVVDGHNVAHDLAVPDRATRDRVVSSVGRIQRLAEGPMTAVVFFDTPEGAETYRNSRVSVRYVPQADDAIEELVSATDDDCVVVTTDKELRARVAAHGAVTLWGSALSDWILRR